MLVAGATLLVGPVVGTAGTVGATESMTPALPAATPPPPIHWAPCPANGTERCSTVPVPIDYAHPAGRLLSLAVAEIPAAGPGSPLGSILYNPGGPGESGVALLPVIHALLPKTLTARFNVIGFDERGTGASDRLDCGPSPAQAAAVDPLPAGTGTRLPAVALYAGMAASCRKANPTLAGHVDTLDAARDLDRIRQALGERRITYLGLSYGTLLGAVYAQLFPTHVRAMVLDGAVVPGMSLARDAVLETPALEASLNHFFTTCSTDPHCGLGPRPRKTFIHLERSLTAHPLPGAGGGPPVTVGTLDTATLYYLSAPLLVDGYPAALLAARHGNGAPLASMAQTLFTDLDGTSLVGPLWSYTCEDAGTHPGPAAAYRLALRLAHRDPLLGAEAATYNFAGCIGWGGPVHPVPAGPAMGAPPIMVIGNKGDPNTPFAGAQALAHRLASGRLVEWKGWGHTWLLNGSANACMDTLVTRYLVHRNAPASGTVCP